MRSNCANTTQKHTTKPLTTNPKPIMENSTVLAVEMLRRKRIPLLNYFLIGVALMIFYSLLLFAVVALLMYASLREPRKDPALY